MFAFAATGAANARGNFDRASNPFAQTQGTPSATQVRGTGRRRLYTSSLEVSAAAISAASAERASVASVEPHVDGLSGEYLGGMGAAHMGGLGAGRVGATSGEHAAYQRQVGRRRAGGLGTRRWDFVFCSNLD
jgi:hypothetical protein